jgi:very-short-patch-repair endonuclease
MAAVLACGPAAALSHRSAGDLWGLRRDRLPEIDVVVPGSAVRSRPGIRVHRQHRLDPTAHRLVESIPVTDPVWTLIDLASCLSDDGLEAAVNEADRLDLVNPEDLRAALESSPRRPGLGRLRALLDRQTFALTDSPLERLFLPLVRSAGLSPPLTQAEVSGFRVDFYWPHLGLVVETDGLRYHRTPSQQTKDRRRDQAHAAAGLTTLRFSTAQVRFEPDHVRSTLAAVAARLEERLKG